MKIYLDNEIRDFRKKVFITSSYNKGIYDDVDVIIDALKAYGHTDMNIKKAFIQKCVEWGLVELSSDLLGEDDANL